MSLKHNSARQGGQGQLERKKIVVRDQETAAKNGHPQY